jgi:hypothetical protein
MANVNFLTVFNLKPLTQPSPMVEGAKRIGFKVRMYNRILITKKKGVRK